MFVLTIDLNIRNEDKAEDSFMTSEMWLNQFHGRFQSLTENKSRVTRGTAAPCGCVFGNIAPPPQHATGDIAKQNQPLVVLLLIEKIISICYIIFLLLVSDF